MAQGCNALQELGSPDSDLGFRVSGLGCTLNPKGPTVLRTDIRKSTE